ncbi:G2/mitotic-specific cyclin-B2 [Tritrichomonas foetus]|uniref:G2/mitotic-specific cyclin-B2 n=1 Tax=Tritrichomonas foetus TaxID=1144522 RepID=A0A1J4JJF9_9EUKA|nr:G2/mitotic-specific cyclin-B2 [Tritrichomonas foetus]|eukprot:OHS98745.1 G2/mitotic-specific cyclin-B2 [Tritrichomonas foetus]
MQPSNIRNEPRPQVCARIHRRALGDVRSKHNSLSMSSQKENIPPNVEISTKVEICSPERLGDSSDPQDAYDFDLEVYSCLKHNEIVRQPAHSLFQNQSSIKPRMRAIVIDWLVDVHKKLKLHTDTLFTAVDIIDLFLSAKDFDKHNLQRLGCAALLIASKSEEINAPDADDFVFFSRNSFSIKDLHETEAEVMKALDFRVNPIHSSYFLKRFLRIADTTLEISMLAHFINEMILLDNEMIGVCPSLRASAVLCLSLSLKKGGGQWTSELQRNTGYSMNQLRPVISKILKAIHYAESAKLLAIVRKYSVDAVCRISETLFPDEFVY